MLKKLLPLFILFFVWMNSTKCLIAQPTDNPYRLKYQPLGQHWTDSLAWNHVFNIQDFTDTTLVARYNKARDAASAAGGGVVYFPAGTYLFEDNIQLSNGVIIRGANPIVTDAKDSSFAPPTRFVFPEYVPGFTGNGTPNSTSFKNISALANSSNIGLIYIDMNRAGIAIGPSTRMTVNIPGKGSTQWSAEQNRNILVFGIRSNNVAAPYSTVPAAGPSTNPGLGQLAWQRFCNPFKSNIGVTAYANLSVCNNRLNDFEGNKVHPIPNESYEQPGYLALKKVSGRDTFVAVANGYMAPFSYTDHHGLSINRKAAVTHAEPWEEPDLFRKGVEILDNWIYHTIRNGISCAGLGLRVEGNMILDKQSKFVYLHPLGVNFQTNNSATYENRGIDWSGWHVNIKNNDITVYKNRINNGPFYSVDGEGILLQECCGGTSMNGATISNNIMRGSDSYIGLWKVRSIANLTISGNDMGNKDIIVTANTYDYGTKKFWYYSLDSVKIINNKNVKDMGIDGNRGGSGGMIANNQIAENLETPCHLQVSKNTFSQLKYTKIFPDSTLASIATASGPCIGTSINPVVAWVYPTKDTSIEYTKNLVWQLEAQTLQGNIVSYEFWDDARRLDSVSAAMPKFSWNIPADYGSTHILTIRGMNDKGLTCWSKPIKVYIKSGVAPTALESQNWLSSEITIFPNPSNGQYTISTHVLSFIDGTHAGNGFNAVNVYDVLGNKVYQFLSKEEVENIQIDLSTQPSGLYLFHIRSLTKTVVQKVLKN